MTKNPRGGPVHPDVKPATRFVTGGRNPGAFHGFVNPPVVHASTVLYPTTDDYVARRSRYTYGRRGTPTSDAFASALAEIEGPECAGMALLPSGLAAASLAIQSAVTAGDHMLVTDNVYGPTRHFCDTVLNRSGVTTTYFDPLIGSGIAALITPKTRAVYLESPGSLSFEVQDVPAIAAAAHARNAVVLMDNTWATPLYFRPLGKGVDLAIQSGSKYIGGHSDLMLGGSPPMRRIGRSSATRFFPWDCASDPTTCISGCGVCAPWQCGLLITIKPASRSRAGSRSGPRSRAFCTRPSKPARATPFGSATSPARAGCSASCSNPCHRPRFTPSSMR
jgi:hypothetical protein